MADAQATSILRPLRRWLDTLVSEASSDRQLLERFLCQQDESAFAVLMNRHGPMVLGVCQRFLRQSHDIEDVFQATFLALARQASSIRNQESLGCWLHSVARRLATKLRASALRRPLVDRRPPRRTCAEPSFEAAARELQEVLDDELQRLPDKYRLPLVLCYLEGRTHEEAARELGWPVGTVKGRLARARDLLRGRLTRRGLTLSAEALATFLASATVPAAVPTTLTAATLKALTGDAPLPIAELATQAIHNLSAMRFKSIGAVLLLFSVVGSGAGLLARHRLELLNQVPAVPPPQASPSGSGKAETPPRTDLYGDPLPPGAVARMGTIRLRGASDRVAFSPDGKQLISTDWLSIRTWETATGKLLKRTPLYAPAGQAIPSFVECLLTADGKSLVAAAKDTLYLWDATTGRERRRISEEKLFAHSVAVSPDGGTLAVGTWSNLPGNPIHLWDAKTGEAKPPLRGHDHWIIALDFSPDGKTLASSSWDGTVRLWDPASGKQVRKLRLTDPFRSLPVMTNHLAFSPDGKLLAAGNYAKSVKLWDVKTGEEKGTLEVPAARTVVSVTFSPDSKMLAAGGNGDVAVFDLRTRKQLHHWPVDFSGLFRFSPDGKVLASCRSGIIRLWDVASGKVTLSWPGHTSPVDWLGALKDGKTLASLSSRGDRIFFWDFSTGKLLRTSQAEPSSFHDGYSRSLSADGKYLASGCTDGTARVWELASGKEVCRLNFELEKGGQMKPLIHACQISPDGKQLAAVGPVFDDPQQRRRHAHLMVWDLDAKKRLVSRRVPDSPLDYLCRFTADGRTLIIPRVEGLSLKDVLTDEERLTIPGEMGPPMVSSPDGGVLAAAIYKPRPRDRGIYRESQEVESVGLWELSTGQCICRLKTRAAAEIAFSPEGRLVVVAGTDALTLFDVTTGKRVLWQPIERINSRFYSSAVCSLAFSPGGQTLATGLTDSSILVWDTSAARKAISRPRELDDKDLDQAWTDLAGEASAAWPAIGTLTAAAPQTLALFEKRLRPAASAPAERLRRLLTKLDSPDFTTRTDATRELEKLGDLAAPVLHRALEDKPSLEVRRRIESVLSAARFVRQPEALRRLRAIRVLEQIGTPESQQLLRKLADGDPSARETAAARDAWMRGQRQAKP